MLGQVRTCLVNPLHVKPGLVRLAQVRLGYVSEIPVKTSYFRLLGFDSLFQVISC